MPVPINQLANSLLEQPLPSESAASVVLDLASVDDPVSMSVAPSAAAAARAMKETWRKAATVAMSSTDEDVLAKLAKSSSVQVRRIVSDRTRRHATQVGLHDWSLSKDLECLHAVVAHMDLEWLLSRREAGERYSNTKVNATIAYRICEERPELIARMCATPSKTIAQVLARVQPPGWDLFALVAAMPAYANTVLAEASARNLGVVDLALVKLFEAHDEARGIMCRSRLPAAKGFTPEAARHLMSFEPNAAENPGSGSFVERVAESNPDPELFDELIDAANLNAMYQLLNCRDTVSAMSDDQLARALLRGPDLVHGEKPAGFSRHRSGLPDTLLAMLQSLGRQLDEEPLLAYLRSAATEPTMRWLTGQCGQTPRPGEAAKLIADPLGAFGWEYNYNSNRDLAFSPMSLSTIASMVVEQLEAFGTAEWADETVDALGGHALPVLIHRWRNAGRSYLADRIRREIGDDGEHWRDALNQLATSNLSLGRTLEAVRRLRGIKRPSAPVELPVEGQLAFAID
jgi:hypothetical protein